MSQIAIIGAGAWGTALSIVLGRKGGHRIRLWVYEKEVRESIAARRVNELFLPGQSIPDSVSPTGDLKEAIHSAEIVVSVMPSHHSRRLFQQMPEVHFYVQTRSICNAAGCSRSRFQPLWSGQAVAPGNSRCSLRSAVWPGC